MKLRLIITLLLMVAISTNSFAQADAGGLIGKVLDEKGQPIPFLVVTAYEGGVQKGFGKTDFNGNYKIAPLAAGIYTVKASFTGYNPVEIQGVKVNSGRRFTQNITMSKKGTKLKKVVIKSGPPLIRVDEPGSQQKSKEEITKIASINPIDAVGTISGVDKGLRGNALNVGGERADGTMYVVDGMMMRGSAAIRNLAPGMIRGIEVYGSGLSAKYGNATGGVVQVNTVGISRELHGGLQAQTSVDGYFNNLVALNLSGPLIFKKDSNKRKIRPLMGFVLSLSGRYNKDSDPAYGGYRVLKPEVLENILENPFINNPTGDLANAYLPAARAVTAEDFTTIKAKDNGDNYNLNYLGKLDFSPTSRMNVTLGTFFDYNRFRGWDFINSLYAPYANALTNSYSARGFLRMQQSLGRDNDENLDAVISNAFYTVQLSYQRGYSKTQNENHGDKIFDYGHIGYFDQETTPTYTFTTTDEGYRGWIFTGDNFTDLTFTPAGKNPYLENYTKFIMDDPRFDPFLSSVNNLQTFQGLANGEAPGYGRFGTFGLFSAPGYQQGSYRFSQSDQFNLNLDASFDINQGIKNKANKDPITHQIEFGLGYEQITSRSYGLNPIALWQLMRQQTNRHILTFETDNPIFVVGGQEYTEAELKAGNIQFSEFDTIRYNRLFAEDDQSRFDKELRKKLFNNERNTDLLFTDNMDPATFSLDMFSPDELYNQGTNAYVGYSGYDYLGNIQRNQPNFRDFWTKKDARDDFARPIAPYNPNYMYGYLLDKFKFKNIAFNVGVRIDRFDANQSVLRDPYSLFGTRNLSSLNSADYRLATNKNTNEKAPDPKAAGYNGDWVPYVDNNQSSQPTLVGYRSGNTWYDPFGTVVLDPTSLSEDYANGLPIQPYLTDPTDSIKSANYKIDNAFTDYKPDIAISPRIQFTFPITDVALFYGNYDIVTQYPQGNNFVTPDNYYYFSERNFTANNPMNNANLQMQRSINYTLGFEQAISKRSKIGLEAYYRERKDQIQLQQFTLAFPQSYAAFTNRDFSTTKGFKFNYKLLRGRKSPIRLTAAYTLQFAEGTGSNAQSAQSLIRSGNPNLRPIFPMSFDTRHFANANLDYRFAPNHNKGPKIKNHYILNGMGANLLWNIRSGRPYTRTLLATQLGQGANVPIVGGFNGTRRPWTSDVGLRIDKDFLLTRLGRKKVDGKILKQSGKPLMMNAYVYVQNLLNTRNVIGVYPYTGLPDDDGFLASPQGQQQLNTAFIYPNSFQEVYNTRIQSPFNLGNPRRIFVGFTMNF